MFLHISCEEDSSVFLPPLFGYPFGDHSCVLMFPDVQRIPSQGSEFPILPGIAFTVRGDLVCPPFGVCFRRHGVLRTPMPKAPVHKDNQSQLHNNNIGTSREIATVQSEPYSPTMEFTS